MSRLEERRCSGCGKAFSSDTRYCPSCGKLHISEQESRPQNRELESSKNGKILVIPLAQTSTRSKEKKETTFIPSKTIEETDFWRKLESQDFPGTGFSINVVSSNNMLQYEIKNLGNDFLGFVECKNTSQGVIMQVRDAKGLLIGIVEGNPQYKRYTIKDRYNKTIGTIQQQGFLKQSYTIENLEKGQILKVKGDHMKKFYSLVENRKNIATVLKTSPETYKMEIKSKIDTRFPILSSIVIDAAQRKNEI
ncbi:MAG: zinc ribbon domain-containing protein [Candidatus Jordarchaeaceae archaeon]